MLNYLFPLAGLLAVALLVQPATAQTLYKSITPDGRVLYSDTPPADAVKTEKKQLDTSKQGVTAPSEREKGTLQQLESDRKTRESAQNRVRQFEIALHDAEVALAMGKEPQPSERLGTAGGGQRLTDEYWVRQKRLEAAVEQARRNLDKVRSGE
jgi:hypothetical protein